MSLSLLVKAGLVWVVIAALAIFNGVLRESLFVPQWGRGLALPLSGLSLCAIVFSVTYLSFSFLGERTANTYLLIGLEWVIITLAFEFLFGHWVAGKAWNEILQTFNILKGDLFILVLLTSLLSPVLVAKMKGILP